MKKLFVLVLVLGWVSGVQAALTLVGAPTDLNVGEKATIMVHSDTAEAYAGWLQIETRSVVDYDGAPQFTPAGDPAGDSTITFDDRWPDWYQFSVGSLDMDKPITAGDHILVNVIGVSEGPTKLFLYEANGQTEIAHVNLTVVPEPATIALLGLGALLLRRRR